MERIKIGVKPVGKPLHAEWVTNDLKSFQNIVGGYIETVTMTSDAVIICNEEGRLMGLPDNCSI